MITEERSIEIAETYYNDVLNFCRSEIRNDSHAEDITQDVFLFFQKHYGELDDTNIKSWLFNVAQKKLLERFRKLKKEAANVPLDENADYLTDSSLLAWRG